MNRPLRPSEFDALCQMLRPLLDDEGVRQELRRRVKGYGNTTAFARSIGLKRQRVTQVARGAPMTRRIAKGLGYRRVVRWERVEE